jgi:hypothetical protein
MPKPNKNESEEEFVSRYMDSQEAKKKFPDAKQRAAVAHSEYKDRKKSEDGIVFVKAPVSNFWEEEVEINKSANATEKSKQRFVEVTVSGLKEDRQGEMMSQEAIDDMIMQFKSGTIPFFPDHGYSDGGGLFGGIRYSWKQMMGVWVDAHQEGEHLKAVVRLNNAHSDSDMFWNFIKEGMPIGFSIGGRPMEEPTELEVEE